MRYKYKLHYTLKYILIGFPILLLLLSAFSPTETVFGNVVIGMENFVDNLSSLDVNSWYVSFIDSLGFISFADSGQYSTILAYYPLYVFWVYLFDLVIDIMTFVPKFIHDLGKKEK